VARVGLLWEQEEAGLEEAGLEERIDLMAFIVFKMELRTCSFVRILENSLSALITCSANDPMCGLAAAAAATRHSDFAAYVMTLMMMSDGGEAVNFG
jgi:hypothetical protein